MADYVVEFGRDGRPVEPDGRLDAAAFHRNHGPIWAVLQKFLAGKPATCWKPAAAPASMWCISPNIRPISPGGRATQRTPSRQHRGVGKHADLPNIRSPLRIDLSDPAWCPAMQDGSGPGELLAVFCANVVHIAPWRVAEGLFAGAARYLRPDGRLFLYGPFKRDGKHTALSNAVFDTSLREQRRRMGRARPRRGRTLAESVGLALIETVQMPSNNLILVFGDHHEGDAGAWRCARLRRLIALSGPLHSTGK